MEIEIIAGYLFPDGLILGTKEIVDLPELIAHYQNLNRGIKAAFSPENDDDTARRERLLALTCFSCLHNLPTQNPLDTYPWLRNFIGQKMQAKIDADIIGREVRQSRKS